MQWYITLPVAAAMLATAAAEAAQSDEVICVPAARTIEAGDALRRADVSRPPARIESPPGLAACPATPSALLEGSRIENWLPGARAGELAPRPGSPAPTGATPSAAQEPSQGVILLSGLVIAAFIAWRKGMWNAG